MLIQALGEAGAPVVLIEFANGEIQRLMLESGDVIEIGPGGQITFENLPLNLVLFGYAGDDLILNLADGTSYTLVGLRTALEGDDPPIIRFSDGEFLTATDL